MTRQDIRHLVEETILQHTDELLILLLTHRLSNIQNPTSKGGCCGGNCGCGSKKSDAPQTRGLLLEEDIITLHREGQMRLQVTKDTIVTPLAADKARDLGIELTHM